MRIAEQDSHHDYPLLLKTHGITPSISGKGNCYDNAVVKTVFKTIESKRVWITTFQPHADDIPP